MNARTFAFACAIVVFFVVGCEKRATRLPEVSTESAYMYLTDAKAPDADAVGRYIAESNRIVVHTTESGLQNSWQAAIDFCDQIHCEVGSSGFSTRNGNSAPSGEMSLRIVPADLSRFFAHLATLGTIASHTTIRQDKTTEVIDVEAKIKNLTTFRDSLRAMLSKPAVTVKDLIEIQNQITDTQTELDSITSERKVLANQTEKIACEISFVVSPVVAGTGALASIRRAVREAGADFMDSTASVITTVVMITPWLVFIAISIWLLAKIWKLTKRRRGGLA